MPDADETPLVVGGRALQLRRWPEERGERLRAFDAADSLLLDHVLAGGPGGPAAAEVEAATGLPAGVALEGRVALLGDRWGALAAGLDGRAAVSLTDSAGAREAARANCARSGAVVPELPGWQEPWPERVDVLLVRLPRALGLLEEQLHRLRGALAPGAVVVAAGRVEEVRTSVLELVADLVGPVRTSRARRKARLLVCRAEEAVLAAERVPPWPRELVLDGPGSLAGARLVQRGGVFSAEHLDVGTRLLVEVLLARRGFAAGERVLDAGCGSGALGLAVARAQPGAEVVFVDDSDLAVASARASWAVSGPAGGRARFLVGDGATAAGSGSEVAAGSVDVVVVNPPFHAHGSVTQAAALRMFRGARQVLRPGGELWVVANRHLGHHVALKRLFGSCEVLSAHPRFVVLRAVRR